MASAGIRNIVILTGAGVSAESGVATFRGPDGLWEGHRVEDVATPEAYRRDPALVTRSTTRGGRSSARSGRTRRMKRWRGSMRNGGASCLWSRRMSTTCTARGIKALLHMHGELKSGWCLAATKGSRGTGRMGGARHVPEFAAGLAESVRTSCGLARSVRHGSHRGGAAKLRPVRVDRDLGRVYPAGFVQTARYCGAQTLELNLEPSRAAFLPRESDREGGELCRRGGGATGLLRPLHPMSL